MQSFTLRSYPKAILHVDGDNFFVSCELTKNPKLKGKPVVTGRERGIATAMSPEAKLRGITRGMPVAKIKREFPDVIILPSDYETYSLYSRRMYEIVRRYTPEVEEYSIDECFADITGFRQYHGMSYESIARKIKEDLENELGMTFSVGLGVNKVSAKLASNYHKPNGFTAIPGYKQHLYLANVPIEKVWMIGPNTAQYLRRFNITTALSFAMCSEKFITTRLHKPQYEIWKELRTELVYPLSNKEKHDYQSISRVHTFSSPSSSRAFLLAELSRHIENSCTKLRSHGLLTRSIFFLLKTNDMRTRGVELSFSTPTSTPQDIVRLVNEHFDELYDSRKVYRATGVVFMKLLPEEHLQLDLFGEATKVKEISTVYKTIDRINQKYGGKKLFLASSLKTKEEAPIPALFTKKELEKHRLNIIYLGKVR